MIILKKCRSPAFRLLTSAPFDSRSLPSAPMPISEPRISVAADTSFTKTKFHSGRTFRRQWEISLLGSWATQPQGLPKPVRTSCSGGLPIWDPHEGQQCGHGESPRFCNHQGREPWSTDLGGAQDRLDVPSRERTERGGVVCPAVWYILSHGMINEMMLIHDPSQDNSLAIWTTTIADTAVLLPTRVRDFSKGSAIASSWCRKPSTLMPKHQRTRAPWESVFCTLATWLKWRTGKEIR